MKCIETLIILHFCKKRFLQILVFKIVRALPGHYWFFTVRYVSQRFDTKPRTKLRIFAHFNTFRNVSNPACKPWGGRGRGFKSRHSDQHKPRKYAVSELSETAYFFCKTGLGHHLGHHFVFLKNAHFRGFIRIPKNLSFFAELRADTFCYFLCLADLFEVHIHTF